jgi:hypothetical protein
MYSQGGLSDIDMYDNPYLGGEENMPQNMYQPMPQNYMGQGYNMPAYAKGGAVKVAKKKPDIRSMAEKIRQKGKGEDTILAHINPLEAKMLKSIGGSGTINPDTGLPQFGLLNNPKKWMKSVAGGGLGAVIGNIMLPGLGGVIGGALGGAAGSKVRGRKDVLGSALRGAGMGAALPTIAGGLGSLANGLGAKGMGQFLTNYGSSNGILSSLDSLIGSSGISAAANGGSMAPTSIMGASASAGVPAGGAGAERLFGSSLLGKAGSFLGKPQNLLALGVAASSMANRPKKQSAKSLAAEQKEFEKAMRLSAEEMKEKEAYLLAEEQMRRRVARNKFLPEERLGAIEPLYTKTATPEEYRKNRRWLEYYNNPEFTGNPLPFKKGGSVKKADNPMNKNIKSTEVIIEMGMPAMHGLGMFLGGSSCGQDDQVHAILSDGEFVIPADVVAHLGDGNNNAGAKKLDEMIKNIRKSKGCKSGLPPKAKCIDCYMEM